MCVAKALAVGSFEANLCIITFQLQDVAPWETGFSWASHYDACSGGKGKYTTAPKIRVTNNMHKGTELCNEPVAGTGFQFKFYRSRLHLGTQKARAF